MQFVIPLSKGELLKRRSGQYYVKDITPIRAITSALDATRVALANEGPNFIVKHFDDFFSILIHGNKLEHYVTVRAFDRLAKALELLVTDMEENFPTGESRAQYLSLNKMYVYLLCSLMAWLEDTTARLETDLQGNVQKKKKSAKAPEREEWEPRRDKILLFIHRWLQLPLQNLWTPPIVEEAFVQLIADLCYKILEHDKENKGKSEVRMTVFQILGVLVKRYLHNITCTIKIIQLVKMHEALGPYLAQGVVDMVSFNDCPGFIAELAREIEQTSLDDTSARNVSLFLEAIATIKPELILPILDNITDYLSNDCYSMRICAINVLGVVVIKALTGDNLTNEQRAKRNECFDYFEAYTRDINTYVRSKVFQVLQKLCCERAIPVDRFPSIMKTTVYHLREKAATVRKQALVLLRVLLEGHPFKSFIDKREIAKKREEFQAKVDKIQEDIVATSDSGHAERLELWKTLSPGIIKAIKDCIDDQEDHDSENEDEEDDDEKYEDIRNLIIQKNFHSAVKKLINITRKQDASADALEDSEKNRYYLHMMLFIFMESSKEDANQQETTANFREQMKKMISVRKILGFFINAETFATEIENALIQIELMLFSPTVTVAVEACTLLSTALTLNIPGAEVAIRKALSQVFSREESVRNNVALIYKDIYLMNNGKKATISSAIAGLINLFKGLQPGQSPALAHLIAIWLGNKDLTDDHIFMIWHTFAKKVPGATIEDSRSAVLLLAMAAETRPAIITGNIDVLVEVGMKTEGDSGERDLLLSRDCCRALLAIKTKDSQEPPLRYPNDHKIFVNLSILLKDNFETSDVDTYVSFAHDAISVIYHLANEPQKLISDISKELNDRLKEPEVDSSSLAKLLYVLGHAAMRHMVFLDTAVYKESKRRNALLEAKKGRKDQPRASNISVCSSVSTVHSSARKARRSMHHRKHKNDESTVTSEDAGEEALGGATADDADAEAIETELEFNIVSGIGFFAHFVPLVIDVCQYPEKYRSNYVQAFGVQALTKMMAISAGFCQQYLQLLITILERSIFPEIRGNILMGLADLMTRFPNEVEPWTTHLYGRLRDKQISVRSTAVRVLASLVKREMIRVKGQMSEMALCIVDEDQQIRLDAKQFFDELSQKGNVLYNILPDILSRLTSTDVDVEEENLHEIVKHILGLLSKEKENDALLDKICQRLKMATTDRQARDLAYCLSLLQLGRKGITTLISKLPLIKNKMHIREVQKALKDIVESAKKKAETREICAQLESEIEKLLDADEEDKDRDEDREAMPPPTVPPKKTVNKKKKKQKQTTEDNSDAEGGVGEDDEEDDENTFRDSSNTPSRRTSRTRASSRTPKRKDLSPEESEESDMRVKRRSNPTPSKSKLKTESSGNIRQSLRKTPDDSCNENPPPKRTRIRRK